MGNKTRIIKAAFAKWIERLGLGWWDIEVAYYDDPAEVIQKFHSYEGGVAAANVSAEWMYGKAQINVNLPAIAHLNEDDIEKIVIHELCHIMVNEMREGELHHEERVVTWLTKAFLWAEAAAREDK